MDPQLLAACVIAASNGLEGPQPESLAQYAIVLYAEVMKRVDEYNAK